MVRKIIWNAETISLQIMMLFHCILIKGGLICAPTEVDNRVVLLGHGVSGKPLHSLPMSRHFELLYNTGIQLLHCAKPLPAFDCLIEAVKVYSSNPRLWLRLAECCIMAHRKVYHIIVATIGQNSRSWCGGTCLELSFFVINTVWEVNSNVSQLCWFDDEYSYFLAQILFIAQRWG